MNRTALTAAAVGLAGFTAAAHADLLSYYNFNNIPSTGAAPLNQTPTQGAGSLTIVAADPTGVTTFNGSTLNALNNDPAGRALAIQGGASNANNGSTTTYALNTTSFQNLVLSYATQGTSTGFTSQAISYSTNGGTTYTPFGNANPIPAAFALRTVDFSNVTALNNNPNARVRITLTGATATSGNNRFDNVQFNAAAVNNGNNTVISAFPTSISLGRVITNAPTSAPVGLTKTGSDTTGFNLLTAGDATASSTGGAFAAGNQSTTFNVGVNTASAGNRSGSVTVDNTAVSSFGPGQGSADPDDIITIAATALDPANASFSESADVNALTVDLGTATQGDPDVTQTFSIFNLLATAGFTSALDLDTINIVGSDDPALSLSLDDFDNLAAGASVTGSATLDTSTVGTFTESYTLTLSDENIPGETQNFLDLTLTGTVVEPAPVPEPATLTLLAAAGSLLLTRRRPTT